MPRLHGRAQPELPQQVHLTTASARTAAKPARALTYERKYRMTATINGTTYAPRHELDLFRDFDREALWASRARLSIRVHLDRAYGVAVGRHRAAES